MTSTYQQIADIVVRLHDVPADLVRAGTTLGALDVDSLTTVEISIRLARDLGVTVGDDELRPDLTLGAIADLVDSRRSTSA
ncbi:acyl carrier protein [Streptomyces sp. enrichment culture]|uniref:acyl carrier protein n=1 Tax=Streptomyces sp. enrichment culture TaxID=1795815 RepID=UPI003F55714D